MNTCTKCSAEFEITDADNAAYKKLSPNVGGVTFQIPPPTLCPDCRLQRRLSFRNGRNLYHRTCDLSGKQIVSMFSADKPYKVYDQEEWWSDKWDGLDYGFDFDLSKDFTSQFDKLMHDVPHVSLNTTNVENSYYTNFCLNQKDCYLIFGGGDNEDCMYSQFIIYSKNTLDSSSIYDCQWCYEGVASQDCYGCHFFTNSRNCQKCTMVEDCEGCTDCILCFGLHRKQYCILNEQLSEEEFKKRRAELYPLTKSKIALLKKKFQDLKRDLPHRHGHNFGSENCTGDMVNNSKNCEYCFEVTKCEDCKYVAFTPNGEFSYDCTFTAPAGVQWTYECCSTLASNSMGTFFAWYCNEAFYSVGCHHSKNIFGCVGLKNKQFCIFNKQFTEEEYYPLVQKIIESMIETKEWGEYLNPSLSCFGYNETVANEYFPLDEAEAKQKGFDWYDTQKTEESYLGQKSEVPENISDVDESICEKILQCEQTGKPYKINPQELKFYQSQGLPLPLISHEARHFNRLLLRNPYHLWKRNCSKCSKEIDTNFSPERPETVYCETCYLEEVY